MNNAIETTQNSRTLKYDNSFNKTGLSLLTAVESDILMAVIEKMGCEMQKDSRGNLCYVAKYHFNDFRELTRSKKIHSEKIINVIEAIFQTSVEFYQDGIYTREHLFSRYHFPSKNEVEIVLSNELTNQLITKDSNYTIIELDEYVSLKKKYSKELYRLLRQFRHSGILIIKKEDLLRFLNPPKKYNEYEFIRKVLDPSIIENSPFFEGLKFSNLESKRNSLPNVCKFTFKKHKKFKDIISERKELNKNYSRQEIELLEYISNNGGGTE